MNIPHDAICETDMLCHGPANEHTYVPTQPAPGLTILARSTASCGGDLDLPADLALAGITGHVQPNAPRQRRHAAVSYLGDRITAAPDLDTLFENARSWLGTHYFHQRRTVGEHPGYFYVPEGDGWIEWSPEEAAKAA